MRSSAEVIVPLVIDLIAPSSVVDVGCGRGIWLEVFRASGVADVLGIDGSWLSPEDLKIPHQQFMSADLERPIRSERHFDLVVSLEVAEHLPSETAETLVNSLVGLGPVVLFSAAIPFQGGRRHVHERWPDYWSELFRRRNYLVIDWLRRQIWTNERVEWWYAQNILLFALRDYVDTHPRLKEAHQLTTLQQLSIVHPKKYLHQRRLLSDPRRIGLRRILRALPGMLAASCLSRLKKLLR